MRALSVISLLMVLFVSSLQADVLTYMRPWTAEQKLAQLLVFGVDVRQPMTQHEHVVDQYQPGGIMVLGSSDNIDVFYTCIHHLVMRFSIPLFVAVDQEGGRVARLKGPEFSLPSARQAAKTMTVAHYEERVFSVGQRLRRIGINMNFAPVADLYLNESNPVIGDRSYGADPREVAAYSTAFVRGMQRAGVFATAKHFPGHGNAYGDSHVMITSSKSSFLNLKKELWPFRELVAQGVDLVMTAHVTYPALDAAHPATFSKRIVLDLLRKSIGFEGVIITDDLNMTGADRGGITRAAIDALNAGATLLLMLDPAGLELNVVSEQVSEATIDRAFMRQLALRYRL